MSQAPGLSGTPDSGHCSSAATRASWAESSARPTSRTIRASPAISLADSILQIASIVRFVAELTRSAMRGLGLLPLLLGGLLAQPLLLVAQLGGELLAEVVGLDELAQLHLAVRERGALQPLERLLLRLHLPDPVAGDELLRLGERAVDHGRRGAAEAHARAVRARAQPVSVE